MTIYHKKPVWLEINYRYLSGELEWDTNLDYLGNVTRLVEKTLDVMTERRPFSDIQDKGDTYHDSVWKVRVDAMQCPMVGPPFGLITVTTNVSELLTAGLLYMFGKHKNRFPYRKQKVEKEDTSGSIEEVAMFG